MMSAVDSGTATQTPGRSERGSDTTIRVSSVSPWKRGFSGCSALTLSTFADTYSVRDWCADEYRTAHSRTPSLNPSVICTGCSTPCARAVASMKPTARSTAPSGSSSSPNVSAR